MNHPLIDLPFLLVSGQARSGTTVLTKAVGSHPGVFSNLKESNYLVDFVWTVKRAVKMETRRRQLIVSESEFLATFRNAIWEVLFPIDKWTQNQPPLAVSTFSAMRSEVADFLVEFFPRVQVVNIVRNGLEVVASRMAHEHIGKRTFKEHCVAWAAAIDMVSWGSHQECFHLIRQEDFLDADCTRRVFAELYDALGLPRESASADFVSKGIINSTRSESDTDQSARDLTTRGDRWKSWDDEQRELFIRICGPAMQTLGYPVPWN